ncbi:hypothetical protein [Streptomyces sp. NPDC002328]|uniref:hypothetical protein n=1 Tax=Streptomyces sp. NPDC002328 TaxID=3364642 RepID=UPI0036AD39AB
MTRPAPPPPRRSPRSPRSPRSVVRRLLLSAALLVPSLLLGSAPPSGAMQPEPPQPSAAVTAFAAAGCASSDFTETVLCWGDAAARGKRSIVVTVSAPQFLRENGGLDAVADAVPELRDRLVVIVPDGVRTGSGGTLLLALASHRIVGAHSTISPLTASEHERLNDLAGCPPDGFCEAVRNRARSGADLVERRLAQDARTSLFTAGPDRATAPQDPGDNGDNGDDGAGGNADSGGAPPADLADDPSGDALAVLFVVGAVLVCLVATLGLMVRRTGAPAESPPRAAPTGTSTKATTAATTASASASTPSPAPNEHRRPVTVPETPAAPRPTAPQPPAPLPTAPQPTAAPQKPPAPTTPHHSATVRTALRPQGYVDVDGLLFRAGWGGPGEPPPPGSPVYVVRHSTGELAVHDHRTAEDDPHA